MWCRQGSVPAVGNPWSVPAQSLAKGKDLFWAFMDLEKAYDRVDRDALWQVLRLYRVGGWQLKAVQSLYVDSDTCVRIGGEVSKWYSVNVVVRQSCIMSL